jgi:hypothetical protein
MMRKAFRNVVGMSLGVVFGALTVTVLAAETAPSDALVTSRATHDPRTWSCIVAGPAG